MNVLVMTSANFNGLPIEYMDHSARTSLTGIVDYFLMYNREIHVPVDDSVLKVVLDQQTMIRRARGFVPEAFKVNHMRNILACGPNMKNTFCISMESQPKLLHRNFRIPSSISLSIPASLSEQTQD